MRTLDIRDRKDPTKLKHLAHFEVLSVMLHPRDKAGREGMMASLKREIGEKKVRRAPLGDAQLLISQKFGTSRGGEAGFLMLALLQLHVSGQKLSLHKAIRLIQNELPVFTAWSATTWRPTDSHEHLPSSPRLLREIFKKFGSVAHLWGALLHEQQWDSWRREKGLEERGDILPISLDRLPRFIGYAEAIWKLYSQLPIKRGRTPSAAFIREPWMCILPTDLHVEVSLKPMPIPKDRAMLFTRSK